MMATKILFNAATKLSSSYELFLPRGTLSRPKSLPKRLKAIQVFRDAMEKTLPQIEEDFGGSRKWTVVVNQPCLHKSNKSPKNRHRTRQRTSTEGRQATSDSHYTAYGYLAAASTTSQSKKDGPVFANRWWMHVDAAKRVDYGPHRRRGKMWRKKIYGEDINSLAGPFET